MTEISPKVGERWRVTYEGEVIPDGLEQHGWLKLRCMVDGGAMTLHPKMGGTWERLPDPEPEWQPGDLVIDAEENIYRRRAAKVPHAEYPWELVGDSGWYNESEPKRPLTRLIRES